MKKKAIIIAIVSVLVTGLILAFLQKLVTPKFITDIPEGSMVQEYYDNYGNNDIIFYGDCEAYEVISPVTLWNDYGVTSYIRGSAQQLVWMSYYLMEETLKYEKPKVIVFSVCDMMYATPDSTSDDSNREAYNRMTLDGMRWSSSKWNSIQESMTSEEREKSGTWSYIFPLLRYHDRIFELTREDWTYLLKSQPVTDNGYLMQVGVKPVTGEFHGRPLADYSFGEKCWEYLEKIRKLCEDNGITLVLMKGPSLWPVWYDEYEAQIEGYANEHGLLYINLLEHLDEIGIDWQTDTYDGGMHINVFGVEKVTEYVGKILQEEYNLPDRHSEEDLAVEWIGKTAAYEHRKAALIEARDEKNKENN